MVVYGLVERSRGSGTQLKRKCTMPKYRCLGAHGQFPIVSGVALIIAIAAFSLALFNMPDENVVQLIAGDNITISPENGYGDVTINSTGGDGAAAENENNVTRIIAGDNITISPENGYGDVTVTAAGNDAALPDNNVTQIIAGDNIIISPENGYGDVTITALVENIRPSQFFEPPTGGDDGNIAQYEEADDMITWIPLPSASHQSAKVDGTTDTSTTSATFENMAQMEITMTTGNNRVLIMFQFVTALTTNAYYAAAIDWEGSWDGIMVDYYSSAPAGRRSITCFVLTDTLAAGSHTFYGGWKIGAGTAYNRPDLAPDDEPRRMMAIELV